MLQVSYNGVKHWNIFPNVNLVMAASKVQVNVKRAGTVTASLPDLSQGYY